MLRGLGFNMLQIPQKWWKIKLFSLSSVIGEHCEVNASSGRCIPGVCKNGGVCVNRLAGGFMCECPPGEYEKPYCEMTTRSFPGQSFVTFRGLKQRFHFTVSFMWVFSFCISSVKSSEIELSSQSRSYTTTTPFPLQEHTEKLSETLRYNGNANYNEYQNFFFFFFYPGK